MKATWVLLLCMLLDVASAQAVRPGTKTPPPQKVLEQPSEAPRRLLRTSPEPATPEIGTGASTETKAEEPAPARLLVWPDLPNVKVRTYANESRIYAVQRATEALEPHLGERIDADQLVVSLTLPRREQLTEQEYANQVPARVRQRGELFLDLVRQLKLPADKNSISDVSVLQRFRGKFVILIGHHTEQGAFEYVDPTGSTSTLDLSSLQRTAAAAGVRLLFIGCGTARTVDFGTEQPVNSLDVLNGIGDAIRALEAHPDATLRLLYAELSRHVVYSFDLREFNDRLVEIREANDASLRSDEVVVRVSPSSEPSPEITNTTGAKVHSIQRGVYIGTHPNTSTLLPCPQWIYSSFEWLYSIDALLLACKALAVIAVLCALAETFNLWIPPMAEALADKGQVWFAVLTTVVYVFWACMLVLLVYVSISSTLDDEPYAAMFFGVLSAAFMGVAFDPKYADIVRSRVTRCCTIAASFLGALASFGTLMFANSCI